MKYRHTVTTGVNEDLFREFLQESCECRALLRAGREILITWPELLEDLFWCFYLPRPVQREERFLYASSLFNRWLLKGFMDTPDYGYFRPLTEGSLFGSAIATLNVGWFLLDHLDREVPPLVNGLYHWENEALQARLHALTWDKILAVSADVTSGSNPGNHPGLIKERDEWLSKEKEYRFQAEQCYNALVEFLYRADPPGRFEPSQRDRVKKEMAQSKLAEGAWGTQSSSWDRKSLAGRDRLMEKINRSAKLKRLVERLGRLRKVKAQSLPGRDSFPAELWGVETGNDLERLLPEEALGFLKPRWKKLFYRNYLEGALSLYRYHRGEEKRKGPMVICIDNSGSMQGPKEEVSKVLALSMLDIAARDRRDLTVLMFGGPGDEIKVFEAPGGILGPSGRMAMAEYFLCSSGTDYTQPLEKALEYLGKHSYTKGDIIFISDGICRVDKVFLEKFCHAKKHLRFKTTCIVIHYGKFTPEGVADFGDEILISKDLLGHDVAPVLWSRFR